LLNPGAPEFRTISQALSTEDHVIPSTECVAHVFPLILPHLIVAIGLFWLLSVRHEARYLQEIERQLPPESAEPSQPPEFRVNLIKALVPLVPITLLFLTGPPLQVISIPKNWLIDVDRPGDLLHFDSRLIGAAMLVGVVLAAAVGGASAWDSARAFFEGAGYALTHIISVIIAATCFGKGVDAIGLAKHLSSLISNRLALLITASGTVPLGFAWICGSGMASTQSLFQFFVEPSQSLDVSPLHVGAVVSIASAAGRTMSPVAAVTLMCATFTETNPFELARRLALPLLGGMVVVILLALAMSNA
jgi:DcuC family C4-dicarboxylate transporter